MPHVHNGQSKGWVRGTQVWCASFNCRVGWMPNRLKRDGKVARCTRVCDKYGNQRNLLKDYWNPSTIARVHIGVVGRTKQYMTKGIMRLSGENTKWLAQSWSICHNDIKDNRCGNPGSRHGDVSNIVTKFYWSVKSFCKIASFSRCLPSSLLIRHSQPQLALQSFLSSSPVNSIPTRNSAVFVWQGSVEQHNVGSFHLNSASCLSTHAKDTFLLLWVTTDWINAIEAADVCKQKKDEQRRWKDQ